MDSIHSNIAVSYCSQDSSEDDAFVVWNRSSGVGPEFVCGFAAVLPAI
jgi:hypothetical protein